MLANVRDRVGPGWPFPPGAMMSGGGRGQEAGSPTQPVSLSSLDFPVCFHEQCTSCQGHWQAGPPSLGTLQGSSSCNKNTVVPFQVLLVAHVGSGMALVLRGDLVSAASLRSGGDSSAAVLCCFPGWHIWPCVRRRQAGVLQRKCLEKGWPCHLGWHRVHTCFEHPACFSVQIFHLEWKQQLLKCDRRASGGLGRLGKL